MYILKIGDKLSKPMDVDKALLVFDNIKDMGIGVELLMIELASYEYTHEVIKGKMLGNTSVVKKGSRQATLEELKIMIGEDFNDITSYFGLSLEEEARMKFDRTRYYDIGEEYVSGKLETIKIGKNHIFY